MADEMSLARTEDATQAKVIESLVMRGDVSGLSPTQRTHYYLKLCDQLGINPATQPLAYLRLNGREVLYATRGATDQLAATHRLTRKIVDGPKIIDVAGTKLVYAVCEATHPNGRVETATATVPLVDPVNVLMKCETKAKRRATLSILGLGILDECELETIPAHARETPRGALGGGEAQPGAEPEPLRLVGVEAPGRSLVDDLVAELSSRPSVTAIAESWQVARSDVAQWAESDRTRVWKAAVARAVALGSTQTALRAEIARLSTPPPDGTSGPARGPAERSTESAPSEASGPAGEATAAQASAWVASLDQTRDHVAAIAHMRHLEASVRSHGSKLSPAQIEIYAARAEALSPPDLYGARETPASLLRRCERWAREGAVAATPAQRRRAA